MSKGNAVSGQESRHVDMQRRFYSELSQVDLIDFQSHPDGEYKFIMAYQDHLTKFVFLRALKTKLAEEEAIQAR
ncbi:integrase core domain protein [Plakobranchus ocellatus]|uniref:Integrase core domain protein n=1 Tax=Plakobranchus ocellatus TaxID=259542 RepID=A0AAV4CHD0_9GAST|nr:integrase core domain protein [Plakobranchus ocellatus]